MAWPKQWIAPQSVTPSTIPAIKLPSIILSLASRFPQHLRPPYLPETEKDTSHRHIALTIPVPFIITLTPYTSTIMSFSCLFHMLELEYEPQWSDCQYPVAQALKYRYNKKPEGDITVY